jgi:hypothetical protein
MVILTLLLSVGDPSSLAALVTILLLAVGSFVGPLAPLTIEVAAECTYPAPEASFTAVQQVRSVPSFLIFQVFARSFFSLFSIFIHLGHLDFSSAVCDANALFLPPFLFATRSWAILHRPA